MIESISFKRLGCHHIILIILLSLFQIIYTQDTFSIIAVDSISGRIGSAGASCIQNSIIISDIHPGSYTYAVILE